MGRKVFAVPPNLMHESILLMRTPEIGKAYTAAVPGDTRPSLNAHCDSAGRSGVMAYIPRHDRAFTLPGSLCRRAKWTYASPSLRFSTAVGIIHPCA